MAGIGFELRKMITTDPGVVARARAYISAGLISAGPWIMTMVGVWFMGIFRPQLTDVQEFESFRALVTYAFAFSLMTVGGLQMSVTRQLADFLYRNEYDEVLPAFSTSMVLVAALQAVVAAVFCGAAGFSVALSLIAIVLYVVVSLNWLALIWLTCVRQHDWIFIAYLAGLLATWLATRMFGDGLGLETALAAYTSGQALTLTILIGVVMRGTEASATRSFAILGCLKRYPELVLAGFFYSAAIWIDKMIFWFSEGVSSYGLIRFHPLYDSCCFLAYITVLPALALNLIHVETSFYERYRSYYAAILHGLPMSAVTRRRTEMIANLREGAIVLLRVQGAITVACLVFAPQLIELFELPPAAIHVFRLACVGALFHVFLLIATLVLLYFDLRTRAMLASFTFLLLNGLLTRISVELGVEYYGLGYAISALLCLGLVMLLLSNGLRDIDYLSFTTQARRAHTR